jgi:hypothetical protein
MLSPIVASSLHSGNTKSHERRVNSTSSSRRWDKAPRWIQDRVSPQAFKTYLVIGQLTCGQKKRISKRFLASRRKVSTKTIYNHQCELERAKALRLGRHKVRHDRNAPNLYILLDIDGQELHRSPERNCMEKKVQILKANTPPRTARVEDSSIVRSMYRVIGDLQRRLRKCGSGKKWHLRRAEERCRLALRAGVGVNRAPVVPITDEERGRHDADIARFRAEREAKIAAEGEARRIEQDWIQAHREGCETCSGTGQERYWDRSVIRYRPCKHGYKMEVRIGEQG